MTFRAWAARLVRKAILATSSDGRDEQIEGYLVDDQDPDYQHPVQRYQHYGLRSRPGPGTELICVAPEGGTSQRVSVASEAPGTGPTDQKEWGVEVYAKQGQRLTFDDQGQAVITVADGKTITIRANGAQIKIDASGNVQIDAAAGGQVTVNGGAKEVARKGDAVTVIGTDSLGGALTITTSVIAAGAPRFKA